MVVSMSLIRSLAVSWFIANLVAWSTTHLVSSPGAAHVLSTVHKFKEKCVSILCFCAVISKSGLLFLKYCNKIDDNYINVIRIVNGAQPYQNNVSIYLSYLFMKLYNFMNFPVKTLYNNLSHFSKRLQNIWHFCRI